MNKKTQITMASCLLSGSVILIGVIIYLAFVFPKTEEMWKEQGRLTGQVSTLSATQMIMVNVSDICKTFGFILIPALFLTVIGCATWAVLAARRNRQESANQGMEHTR